MAASASASGRRLIALDFDGVVCDSVGESSLSAFRAAAKLWPDVFGTPAAEARKGELVEKMRAVRPVVETGYENIVQIRALLEGVSVEARRRAARRFRLLARSRAGAAGRSAHLVPPPTPRIPRGKRSLCSSQAL